MGWPIWVAKKWGEGYRDAKWRQSGMKMLNHLLWYSACLPASEDHVSWEKNYSSTYAIANTSMSSWRQTKHMYIYPIDEISMTDAYVLLLSHTQHLRCWATARHGCFLMIPLLWLAVRSEQAALMCSLGPSTKNQSEPVTATKTPGQLMTRRVLCS